MKDIRFSIEEIKVVAFDVFSGPQVFEDSFAQQYHGAQLLVSALEAAAVADLPGPGEDELAAAPEPEEAPKKEDPGKIAGYGAKLKRETFARLTEARKKGVTLSTIIAASGGGAQGGRSDRHARLQEGELQPVEDLRGCLEPAARE